MAQDEKSNKQVREDLEELRRQLEGGSIQRGYRELLSFMMGLRSRFAKVYGEDGVSGIYQGYMDMTYFAVFPGGLKARGLKVAVVFSYDGFRFEGWLSGRNRKVQREYWEYFKVKGCGDYRVVAPGEGVDSVVECVLGGGEELVEAGFAGRIEGGVREFIGVVEGALAGKK